jgi:hypothetical protein
MLSALVHPHVAFIGVLVGIILLGLLITKLEPHIEGELVKEPKGAE